MTMSILITSLVSGLAGALLSTWIFIRRERQRMKLDTLRDLWGNKFRMTSPEFLKALNEIFVVYNDSETVLKKLEVFVSTARNNNPANPNPAADEDFVRLLRAMCDSAGIKHADMSDTFMKTFLGNTVNQAVVRLTPQGSQGAVARPGKGASS